jgi:hypothetical protein
VSGFVFAIVSDAHASEAPREGRPGGVGSLQRCLASIAEQPSEWQPEFLFLLGDLHPWAFADGLPEAPFPYHATAGNHEHGERRQQLRDLLPADFARDGAPADYYAFVHEGVRFVAMCDAGAGGDHVGHLCSQAIQPPGQMDWLSGQLHEPEPTKIVFTHIPPHPDCAEDHMSLAPNDARWLRDLFDETRPAALFCGHQHRPTREERFGETPLFVLRSAAWNFDDVPTGYALVRVDDGAVEVRDVLTA